MKSSETRKERESLFDAADKLAAAAVINVDETGENLAVTVPIEDWREFWAFVNAVQKVEAPFRRRTHRV